MEAAKLGEIGAVFARQDLSVVEVRLPKPLAQSAVEACERDDPEEASHSETLEQYIERHHAGTLALIGAAIEERGHSEGDDVVVPLSPDIIGMAVMASEISPDLK